jgi:acetyl esterase
MMPVGTAGLDPILAEALHANPFQLLGDDGVAAARRRLRAASAGAPAQPLPAVRVESRHLRISSPHGVHIRIYWPPDNPARVGKRSTLMFFHGGGFCVGDLDTHDAAARRHSVGADAMVISVGYRLAPEHPYPGTISAAMTQLARDAGGPAISFQVLWYPTLMWDPTLPSYAENADAPVVNAWSVAQFRHWYAGDLDPVTAPPTLAPGRNPNLSGLPPAYIGVAGGARCVMKASAMPNCCEPQACSRNCPMPKGWFMASSTSRASSPPQPRPPTVVSRRCGVH